MADELAWDEKIMYLSKAVDFVRLLKEKGKRIVFTNGCFDILHRGHIRYLSEAKALGDVLVVGLNSDTSVRRIKGQRRPIQDEVSRAEILASLSFVDVVVPFEEDTPINLILALEPHILVKGGDWRVEHIVGAKEVIERGGVVKTIGYLPEYSTTSIIERILERFK